MTLRSRNLLAFALAALCAGMAPTGFAQEFQLTAPAGTEDLPETSEPTEEEEQGSEELSPEEEDVPVEAEGTEEETAVPSAAEPHVQLREPTLHVHEVPRHRQILLPPFSFDEGLKDDTFVKNVAVFPFFFLREELRMDEHRASSLELAIPPFYHKEEDVEDDSLTVIRRDTTDALFPAFYWLRGSGHFTFQLGPFVLHESSHARASDGKTIAEYDLAVAPLLFMGSHASASGKGDNSSYFLIPPLLTGGFTDEDERFVLAGPFYLHNKTTEIDDGVKESDERFALFPFLWARNSTRENYHFVPPVFFSYEKPGDHHLWVIPPFYHMEKETDGETFTGVLPFFHYNHGNHHYSTTIYPLLFHLFESPKEFRLITPLFGYETHANARNADERFETLVTPVYQMHRGPQDSWDASFPFYYHQENRAEHSQLTAITPLFWYGSSPRREDIVAAPVFARFHQKGDSTTTLIFPTLQISQWIDGDAVNLHPLFYFESVPSHQHLAIAPLYFDFDHKNPSTRHTIIPPLLYGFVREGTTDTQILANTYYRHRELPNNGYEWEFHFFPLFDYMKRHDGNRWRFLYGLFGHEQRGARSQATVFWIQP